MNPTTVQTGQPYAMLNEAMDSLSNTYTSQNKILHQCVVCFKSLIRNLTPEFFKSGLTNYINASKSKLYPATC